MLRPFTRYISAVFRGKKKTSRQVALTTYSATAGDVAVGPVDPGRWAGCNRCARA